MSHPAEESTATILLTAIPKTDWSAAQKSWKKRMKNAANSWQNSAMKFELQREGLFHRSFQFFEIA